MQNSGNTIYFNFSYFALRLLGKGLYSNHWSAISELVANGLDAQASNVKIYINMIDKRNSIIEILDNGSGMGYLDLSEKYALIGKDKREDGELTDEIKKQLMGRKGIGKLAALYLSNKYYLISKTKGEDESAWCLDASDVKDSDIPHLDRCQRCNVGIECKNEWNDFETGTLIHLTNVDLTNFGVKTLEGLKARLADFYLTELLKGQIEVCVLMSRKDPKVFQRIEKSIAFKNFYAFFNNTKIDFDSRLAAGVKIVTPVDSISRKDWPVVKVDSNQFKVSGKKFFNKANGELTENELEYEMIGWIGIHTSINKEDAILNDPDYLKNKAYRPNQLRLYVRKKLAVENFLDYIKNTQAFSNYIEGEISFDILDDNELGDIATSNRQGFVEDDERVQLLIEILKPIINYLIRMRIKIANQVSSEVDFYYEEEKRKEEEHRKAEEEKRKQAELEALRVEEERKMAILDKEAAEEESKKQKERADKFYANWGSEKKRNYFLVDSLDEKQVDFAKRLHMLKINTATMQKAIKNSVMKLQRGRFKEEDAWEWLKKMSYYVSRIQAVLEYSAVASFNTKEEYVVGDLFIFIKEYCGKLIKNEEIEIETIIEENSYFPLRFVPQDIIIIVDNVISNSIKNGANHLKIVLAYDNKEAKIDFIDDGKGLDSNIIDIDELFEFGKGFTSTGTGVGLYHIKDITVNKLNGSVNILSEPDSGFTLQIRIRG
ncbi:MAG: ATP-binding protein [Ruminococcus flavefaciens]|nr:ATP-binding protein [Ruminococcus flavefaciens]